MNPKQKGPRLFTVEEIIEDFIVTKTIRVMWLVKLVKEVRKVAIQTKRMVVKR